MNQNAISRLESPEYGKATITTLTRLASAFDVGLIVRFVPFSEIVDWVSGTPRTIEGLTPMALAVPGFDKEESNRVFEEQPRVSRIGSGAANSAQRVWETTEVLDIPRPKDQPPASASESAFMDLGRTYTNPQKLVAGQQALQAQV